MKSSVESKPPEFRGDAFEIQTTTLREWILSGPSETGKTWACLWRLDSLLRETPRAQAALARKTRNTINSTVLVTFRRIQELRDALGAAPALPYGGKNPDWFDYPNGSRLWIGGLDDPNKILSSERDWIYINQAEELSLEDWEYLLTRCTGRGAVTKTPMVFGDCNPGAEDHWILKRETLKLFHSYHEDNPSLFDEEGNKTEQGERTMATLDSLTGVRKARLRYGKWVGAEGLFFEEFDEELHTCEPFEIPGDWPIWGAFDYGFKHPTAFGLLTEDNDGVIYLIGEHVRNKWLAAAHCKAIQDLMKKLEIEPDRVTRIVAGHDCFQVRGAKDGKTIADHYAEALDPETGEEIGLLFERATVDRVTGAQELLTRLGTPSKTFRRR